MVWKKITAKNKSSNFSTTVSNLWLKIARGPQKQGPCLITSSDCFIHIFFNDYTGIPDPPENARNNKITSLAKYAVLCLRNVELSKTTKCPRSWQSIRSKWKCKLSSQSVAIRETTALLSLKVSVLERNSVMALNRNLWLKMRVTLLRYLVVRNWRPLCEEGGNK